MKYFKKSLCIFLVVLMIMSSIPMSSFAKVDWSTFSVTASDKGTEEELSVAEKVVPVLAQQEALPDGTDTQTETTETFSENGILEFEVTQEMEQKEYYQQISEPEEPDKCGERCMWIYDEEALKLTIKGVGAIDDYSQAETPWKDFADKIEILDIDIGITSVGEGAFAGLTALKTVYFPTTLAEIGDNAFSACVAIETVIYPSYEEDWATVIIGEGNDLLTAVTVDCYRKFDSGECSESITWALYTNGVLKIDGTGELGDYTILDETGDVDDFNSPWIAYTDVIKKVELSEGITSLGHGAFGMCMNMTEISLPSTLELIGDASFTYCTKLREIVIPEMVTSIGYATFLYCTDMRKVEIKGDITEIGDIAFGYCSELQKIDLPDSLEKIGQMAFAFCKMLESIEIPASVKEIPYGAFAYCEVLDAFIFNEGLETISELAFYYSGVSQMDFPTTLKTIDQNAFYGCVNLKSITLPDGLTELGHNAFAHCIEITSVSIPGSLEVIGSDAFTGCESLMAVAINEGVKEIGLGAFFGCKTASTVLIADTVEVIGTQAFSGCSSLSTIVLPSSLTQIDENAFANCTSLKNVSFNGTEEEWNTVTVSQGNDCLINAGIVFSDGEAETGEIFSGTFGEGLTWEYRTVSRTLKISGQGAIPSYAAENFAQVYAKALGTEEAKEITAEPAPWAEYEQEADKLIIEEGITSIGDYTFAYCDDLVSVSFPSTLKSIGEGCFFFSSYVKEIIYPEGLETIGDNVFSTASFVSKYYLPSTLRDYKFSALVWTSCEVICNAECEADIKYMINLDSLLGEGSDLLVALIFVFLSESNKSTSGFYENGIATEDTPALLSEKYEKIYGIKFPIDESILLVLALMAFLLLDPPTQCATDDLTLKIPEGSSVHKYAKDNYILHYVGENAESCTCFECEGELTETITYLLDMDTGILTFDGSGDFPADIEDPSQLPYNNAARLINKIAFTEDSTITSISNLAFYNLALEDIVIPNTVNSIGIGAYYNSGTGDEYVIGENVSYIGAGAFRNSKVKTFTVLNEECEFGSGECIFPSDATLKGNYNSASEIYAGQNSLNFETEEYTPEDHFAYEENEDGTVTVTGFKIITKYVRMPETLDGKKITAIDDNAFYYHTIISVELPDSIKYIGNKAFYYSGVRKLKLPASLETVGDYAFYTTALTELELPEKLKTIGEYGFAYSQKIKELSIPDSVTTVGSNAFCSLTELEEVYIGSGVISGLENAFSSTCPKKYTVSHDNTAYRSELGVLYNKDVTTLIAYPGKKTAASFYLPETVTEINAGAFYANYGLSYAYSNLRYIELNNNIKEIKANTFSGCAKLTEIALGNSVESIADGAFEKCVSLEYITLPDSVTSIQSGAFRGCSKLADVYIGSGLKEIEYNTFGTQDLYADVKTVKNYYIRESNPAYAAVDGVIFSKDMTTLAFYPTENERTTYTVPDGTKILGNRSFVNSKKLTKIVLPDTVSQLEAFAFEGCTALSDIKLPDAVTTIPNYTFEGCTSLENFTISDSVTEIGSIVFLNSGLKNVTVGSGITTITPYTFATSNTSYESDIRKNKNVANYYISENNPNYCDVDGVLFNKDKTVLVSCPSENERTHYIVPDSVRTIGSSAFLNCANLTEIIIPEGVEIIESGAFSGCSALENVFIPDSVTTVDSNAFGSCEAIETFSIGSGLTNCSSIPLAREYVVDKNNTAYLSEDGVLFNKDKTTLYRYPAKNERTEYAIPGTVTRIGNSAFSGSLNLETVTIPTSVQSIGDYAFMQASKIESIVIPYGVTSLGYYTFSQCSALTSVTIPETVTYINYYAFYYRSADLTIYGVTDSAAHVYAEDNQINFVDRSSGATVKVLDSKGNACSTDCTIKWYDSDGNYVATGSKLHGAVDGREYYYEIILNASLSYKYKVPEKTKIVHSIESPDYTYTLEEIPNAVISGTVTDEEGNALKDVYIDITQIFNYQYESNRYAYTDENGGFSITLSQVPTALTYNATGYYKKNVNLFDIQAENDASVVLKELSNNKITLSLTELSAVEEGQEPTETVLSNANGLRFELYNVYEDCAITDYELQYPTIYIGDNQVNAYDEVRITAVDVKGERTAEPVYIYLDSNSVGNAEITLRRNGSFTANVTALDRTLAIVFDEDGNRVYKNSFSDSAYTSQALADGIYTVVFIKNSTYISGVSKLSNLDKMGLVEATDYIKKSVVIQAGKITPLGDISVPVFDESGFYFTVKEKTNVSANTTSAVAGKYITVRAEYKIDGQYDTSNQVVKIQFPEGVSPVEGSVTVDSKVRPYTYDEQERAVYITVNKPQATVRFYCIGATEGKHSVDALLSFNCNGDEILQPIGSANFELVTASITAIEQTKDETIYVSGATVPGAKVDIYADGELAGTVTANKVGSWMSQITLKNTFNYSYHDIYASISSDRFDVKINTDTATVLYNKAHVQATKLTMYVPYLFGSVVEFDLVKPSTPDSYNVELYPAKFTFTAEFDGDEAKAKDVYVVAGLGSGEYRKIPMAYDKYKNIWVAYVELDPGIGEAVLGANLVYDYDMPEGFSYFDEEDALENSDEVIEEAEEKLDGMFDIEINTVTEDYMVMEYVLNSDNDIRYKTFVSPLDYSMFDGFTEEDGLVNVSEDGSELYQTMYMDDWLTVQVFVDRDNEQAWMLFMPTLGEAPEAEDSGEFDFEAERQDYYAATKSVSLGTVLTNIGDAALDIIDEYLENQDDYEDLYTDLSDLMNGNYDVFKAIERELESMGESITEVIPFYEEVEACAKLKMLERTRDEKYEETLNKVAELRSAINKTCEDTGEPALSSSLRTAYSNQADSISADTDELKGTVDRTLSDFAKRILGATGMELLATLVGAKAAKAGMLLNKLMMKYMGIHKYMNFVNSITMKRMSKITKIINKMSEGAAEKFFEELKKKYEDKFNLDPSECENLIKGFDELISKLKALIEEVKGQYSCNEDDELIIALLLCYLIIDPSGYVYEAVPSNRIEGVKAEAYYYDYPLDEFGVPKDEKELILWDAENYDQVNPLYTDADGRYAWDVPPGQWVVKYSKEGYYDTDSTNDVACDEDGFLPVPPPQTEVNTAIVSRAAPTVDSVNTYEDSVQIIFSQYMQIGTVNTDNVRVNIGGEAVTGTITASNAEYDYEGVNEYASVFTFTPDEKISGTASVTVENVVNYAGKTIESAYEVTKPVTVRPEGITATENVKITYGSGSLAEVTVYPAEAGRNRTLTVTSSNENMVKVLTETVTTDENGKAHITLEGELPGDSTVTVTVDGTDISTEFTASVSNVDESSGKCETVTSSIANGSRVPAGTTVTLSTATEDAEIYYTLDGTCPCVLGSTSRLHYEGPITIDKDTLIIAYAVKEGYEDSQTAGFVYTLQTECTHSSISPINAVPAKCTVSGTKAYYKCDSCDKKFTDSSASEEIIDIVVPATGHKGGTATCKEKAVCTVCGTSYGSLAAHSYSPATCTEAKTCLICKATEGKAKEHSLTKLNEVPATYKATGLTEGEKCTVCGTVTVVQQITEKLTLGKPEGLKVKAVKVASGTKTTLTLTWDNMGDGVKYEVYQKNGKKWTKVGKATSKNSVTVKKLKSNKSYKFKVKAIVDGATAESKVLTVKTVPLKTTLSLKAGKSQVTASWSTVANITGYEVEYSTAKNFKKDKKVVTIKKAKTKKTTIKKLKKGKKYFVRVRAYKTVGGKKIYGAWSSVKSVKVK